MVRAFAYTLRADLDALDHMSRASGPPLIARIAPCVAVAPPLGDIALCDSQAS